MATFFVLSVGEHSTVPNSIDNFWIDMCLFLHLLSGIYVCSCSSQATWLNILERMFVWFCLKMGYCLGPKQIKQIVKYIVIQTWGCKSHATAKPIKKPLQQFLHGFSRFKWWVSDCPTTFCQGFHMKSHEIPMFAKETLDAGRANLPSLVQWPDRWILVDPGGSWWISRRVQRTIEAQKIQSFQQEM